LKFLNVSKNKFEKYDDIVGLLECPSLIQVDLSFTSLEHDETMLNIFQQMPNLGNLALKRTELHHKFK
jgi:hypothetical protein